ncbi:AgrD family cyclic lactone autoinducer peptide [Paenibacillus thalictri]|uniref:Cyclic lactone autoinducer peptide n=1 Tax=Paenibacillus thalictri TaxID=2527873 RepID=A0A4Q9DVY3_9BACL|nr:cyclic lactone autoinducer peptide [Paenibacillus thalictri]TBL81189.1 cyclic lactone autoinducer peptide [Paenibacillus thalictri]
MKAKAAIIANAVLVIVAAFFVGTNSWIGHRPETPQELLK